MPQVTGPLWPVKTAMHAAVGAFHIQAVKSSAPASTTGPRGCQQHHCSTTRGNAGLAQKVNAGRSSALTTVHGMPSGTPHYHCAWWPYGLAFHVLNDGGKEKRGAPVRYTSKVPMWCTHGVPVQCTSGVPVALASMPPEGPSSLAFCS